IIAGQVNFEAFYRLEDQATAEVFVGIVVVKVPPRSINDRHLILWIPRERRDLARHHGPDIELLEEAGGIVFSERIQRGVPRADIDRSQAEVRVVGPVYKVE